MLFYASQKCRVNILIRTGIRIDYYLVSDVMGKTELIEIANSVSAIPIMK